MTLQSMARVKFWNVFIPSSGCVARALNIDFLIQLNQYKKGFNNLKAPDTDAI